MESAEAYSKGATTTMLAATDQIQRSTERPFAWHAMLVISIGTAVVFALLTIAATIRELKEGS